MKKYMSWLLCVALLVGVIQTSATAYTTNAGEITIDTLADEYITVSEYDNETVYSNLQEFYAAVKENLPMVSDLELCKFVMDYTGQSYDNLTDEIILENLDFLEISTSISIFEISPSGLVRELPSDEINAILENGDILPFADYPTSDGYLKFTTNSSKGSATTGGTPFTLVAGATWLKMPAILWEDTFSLAYGGSFDDSYQLSATLIESGKCNVCGKTITINEAKRYENGRPTRDSKYIDFDFSESNIISAYIDLRALNKSHDTGATPNALKPSSITTTLRFRVLTNSTTEAKAAYGHSIVTLGRIQISATPKSNNTIGVSFSNLVPSIGYQSYTAPPITLRCP